MRHEGVRRLPRLPSYEELLAFTRAIASQNKDGDIDEDGEEYLADGNDDEVDAYYSLISDARDLLGTNGSDLEPTTPGANP